MGKARTSSIPGDLLTYCVTHADHVSLQFIFPAGVAVDTYKRAVL